MRLTYLPTLLNQLFSNRTITSFEVLTGGLINTNIKLTFQSSDEVLLLRFFRDGPEVCRKELAVFNRIRETVPVPRILDTYPDGLNGSPPFSILSYVESITFQELKRTKNVKAIGEAAASIGECLALIGQHRFSGAGRLISSDGDELNPGEPYATGPEAIPVLMDGFLTSRLVEQRAGADLIARLHEFIWSANSSLPNLEQQTNLVHGDFGNRNIIVSEMAGKWSAAAILDWELAFSGSPLLDVGHFLRYELAANPLREPYFSNAFIASGGQLPDDWRRIVRIIDLTGLVECLTHENLPSDVEAELLELINATLDDRDPDV